MKKRSNLTVNIEFSANLLGFVYPVKNRLTITKVNETEQRKIDLRDVDLSSNNISVYVPQFVFHRLEENIRELGNETKRIYRNKHAVLQTRNGTYHNEEVCTCLIYIKRISLVMYPIRTLGRGPISAESKS